MRFKIAKIVVDVWYLLRVKNNMIVFYPGLGKIHRYRPIGQGKSGNNNLKDLYKPSRL